MPHAKDSRVDRRAASFLCINVRSIFEFVFANYCFCEIAIGDGI